MFDLFYGWWFYVMCVVTACVVALCCLFVNLLRNCSVESKTNFPIGTNKIYLDLDLATNLWLTEVSISTFCWRYQLIIIMSIEDINVLYFQQIPFTRFEVSLWSFIFHVQLCCYHCMGSLLRSVINLTIFTHGFVVWYIFLYFLYINYNISWGILLYKYYYSVMIWCNIFFTSKFSALLPPKLTVNPPVITETDSVTLNCQTPSSVSVSQCYFYTLSGGTNRVFSCLKTLTGTELLKMAHQSSPAEVKVKCFYTVKYGESNSPSPHSDTSSITIHSEWTLLLWTHILITCYSITTNNKVALNIKVESSEEVLKEFQSDHPQHF